jgi:hypothetical protein
VAISTNTLRILALEKLGAVFNQAAYPLDFTPRKFVLHPESASLVGIFGKSLRHKMKKILVFVDYLESVLSSC